MSSNIPLHNGIAYVTMAIFSIHQLMIIRVAGIRFCCYNLNTTKDTNFLIGICILKISKYVIIRYKSTFCGLVWRVGHIQIIIHRKYIRPSLK